MSDRNRMDEGWWPCACVKGGSVAKRRPSTHFKIQPPTVARCSKCGATREAARRIAQRLAAERTP